MWAVHGCIWLCMVKPTSAGQPPGGRPGRARYPRAWVLLTRRMHVLSGVARDGCDGPAQGPRGLGGSVCTGFPLGDISPPPGDTRRPPPRRAPSRTPVPIAGWGVWHPLPALSWAPGGSEEPDVSVALCPGLGLAEKAVRGGPPVPEGPRATRPGDCVQAAGDADTGLLLRAPLRWRLRLRAWRTDGRRRRRPRSREGTVRAGLSGASGPRTSGAGTHVVFLALELLPELELLGLQLVQGLPQLLGLVPGGRRGSGLVEGARGAHGPTPWGPTPRVPQLVLTQVVNVERLAPLGQNLLLHLAGRLLLASLLVGLRGGGHAGGRVSAGGPAWVAGGPGSACGRTLAR